ncbi:hypothetical protein [Cyanobium sp. ATX-6F1]|uniref:hypothetical protein n=1 Tax=Cyanobium sp. ATX-6F1 TaxID=3137388 RepID=UPI0039BE7031
MGSYRQQAAAQRVEALIEQRLRSSTITLGSDPAIDLVGISIDWQKNPPQIDARVRVTDPDLPTPKQVAAVQEFINQQQAPMRFRLLVQRTAVDLIGPETPPNPAAMGGQLSWGCRCREPFHRTSTSSPLSWPLPCPLPMAPRPVPLAARVRRQRQAEQIGDHVVPGEAAPWPKPPRSLMTSPNPAGPRGPGRGWAFGGSRFVVPCLAITPTTGQRAHGRAQPGRSPGDMAQGRVKPDCRFLRSSITQVTQITSATRPEIAATFALALRTTSRRLISFMGRSSGPSILLPPGSPGLKACR